MHYDCTGAEVNDVAGLEVHMFPSSDTEQSMSVVTRAQGHKEGKEFEEDCQQEDSQFSTTAGTYPSRTIHRVIDKFERDELNVTLPIQYKHPSSHPTVQLAAHCTIMVKHRQWPLSMISPRNPLQMFAGKSILGEELALTSHEAMFENF